LIRLLKFVVELRSQGIKPLCVANTRTFPLPLELLQFVEAIIKVILVASLESADYLILY
jgi:hypothetical protein